MIRGCGLIAVVELVANRAIKEPFGQPGHLGRYFTGRAQEHGRLCAASVTPSPCSHH
jgi:4-aminobutyrate--pyruvate transaminase